MAMWALHDVGSGELIDAFVDDDSGTGGIRRRDRVFKGGTGVGGGNAVAEPGAELLMEGCECADGWCRRLGEGTSGGGATVAGGGGSVGCEVAEDGEGEVGGVGVVDGGRAQFGELGG